MLLWLINFLINEEIDVNVKLLSQLTFSASNPAEIRSK